MEDEDYWGTTDSSTPAVQPTEQVPVEAPAPKSTSRKVLVVSLVGFLVLILVVLALVVGKNLLSSNNSRSLEESKPSKSTTVTVPEAKAPVEKKVPADPGTVPPVPKEGAAFTPVDVNSLVFSESYAAKAMVLNKSVYKYQGVVLFKVDYVFSENNARTSQFVNKTTFDSTEVGSVVELNYRLVDGNSVAILK